MGKRLFGLILVSVLSIITLGSLRNIVLSSPTRTINLGATRGSYLDYTPSLYGTPFGM